ncbi:MAG TPA: polysaccharide pyruvyl transferase family protein [Candidatus Saccharimonadales bacterium]|nr:polysaccharide pyruvyl transferase family protein [Candidatus Saccharimonadales bacterium]
MAAIARKPILLLGSYGRGNIGDDAFLAAALKHFPEETPLFLNSAHDELLPKAARGRVQTIATSDSRDFKKKLRVFRAIKHVVYCGGDLWVELYGDRYPRQSLYKMLGMNLLARLAGKKVHYLGCGIGNLRGYSLLLARASARLAHTVIVREPRSAKLLGLKKSVVLPDLVASLGWPVQPAARQKGQPFTIGISILYHLPNPEQTFPQLLETLHDFVASLPAGKFRVVIFPMLISPSDPKDDLWASRQLQLALEDTDAVISPARELEDFVAGLGTVDLMIGARLHANILAMLTGTPTLGIAYRPKVASFFAANKLRDYCIDLSKLTAQNLSEVFWDMYGHYGHVQQQVMDARARSIQEGAAYQTFITRHF